jgi:hypothetical protein
MPLFSTSDRAYAAMAVDLMGTNPFHPDWMVKQRELLGPAAADPGDVYAWQPEWDLWGPQTGYGDVARFGDRVTALATAAGDRLRAGVKANAAELELYQTLALYVLYRTCGEELDRLIKARVEADRATADPPEDRGSTRRTDAPATSQPAEPAPAPDQTAQWGKLWRRFAAHHGRLLDLPGREWPLELDAGHLFACYFVLRRAFFHIFFNVAGTSPAAAQLRTAIWQSVVTCDLRGWSQWGHGRMQDTPTLITGPSGTGKELVAQAIGRSQYIAFNTKTAAFAADFVDAFRPVNVAALPAQLVESELFGHVKGAFTGAVADRAGRLDKCPPGVAVFLDEIGELTGELQVKLLRVLQTRRFNRVGENATREFGGKVIAATNRDLAAEIDAGRFREDLYYRLCPDRVVTPSLREQLSGRPGDLLLLVQHICRRVVGGGHAARLADEVAGWIGRVLGPAYAWPGNFRELEQCVRSYAIRREYHPLRRADLAGGAARLYAALADEVAAGRLGYDAVERGVFAEVYRRAGSWQEAGRLLGVDWRTVRARVQGEPRKRGEPARRGNA